jgi:tetratricopeptide (TPR) repeat protein
MNRTTLIKLLYFGSVGLALIAVIYLVGVTEGAPFLAVLIFLLLFTPGRVTGYLWRDLIAGRRLLDAGHYTQAITLFESFHTNIRRKRWLKWVIWFTPSLYTTSAEALTLNNLGACYLELGDIDKAKELFNNALSIDHRYPIPHYNLAIVEMYHRQTEYSERHLAEAVRLGFAGGTMDKVIQKTKSIYAQIEPMARHVN